MFVHEVQAVSLDVSIAVVIAIIFSAKGKQMCCTQEQGEGNLEGKLITGTSRREAGCMRGFEKCFLTNNPNLCDRVGL